MYLAFAILGAAPPATAADEPEVQRLVGAAREGDRRAARQLYSLHVRQVFRAVRPLCQGEAEAEDVVQETFVKVLSSLGRYRQHGATRFVSWVLTIAMNIARKGLRHHRREVAVDGHALDAREVPCGSLDPAGEALDLQLRKRALLAALAELPLRQRQVVTLRYGAGLSAAEVGRVAGLAEANVRKICQRQRASLLDRIQHLLNTVEAGGNGPKAGGRWLSEVNSDE